MLKTRMLFFSNCIQVKNFHDVVTTSTEMAVKIIKDFFFKV